MQYPPLPSEKAFSPPLVGAAVALVGFVLLRLRHVKRFSPALLGKRQTISFVQYAELHPTRRINLNTDTMAHCSGLLHPRVDTCLCLRAVVKKMHRATPRHAAAAATALFNY